MKRLLLLSLFLAAPLQAQNCTASITNCSTANLSLSITIGRALQLAIASSTTALTAPTKSDYDASFAATDGPTLTIRSNAPWTLAISSTATFWTATNTSGTEPARTNKPASDLTWSTLSNGTFRALTSAPFTVTSGASTNSATVSLFYRTLYAWSLDTPGIYSLPIVFTITAP